MFVMDKDGQILGDMNRAVLLFDAYGSLLSARSRQIFDYYLNEDLNLTEIGEILSISRQAVFSNLKTNLKKLEKYESELAVLANDKNRREKLRSLKSLLENDKNDEAIELINTLLNN